MSDTNGRRVAHKTLRKLLALGALAGVYFFATVGAAGLMMAATDMSAQAGLGTAVVATVVVVTEEATAVPRRWPRRPRRRACWRAWWRSFRRRGARTLLARPLVWLWRRFVLAIDAGRIHLDLRLR